MVNLNLTKDEVQIVLVALGELPAKHSVNVLIKVQQQAQAQLAAQQAEKDVEKESE